MTIFKRTDIILLIFESKYECIKAFIQLCSKYSSRTSSYALLFSMKCFGFAPLIRRVNEHFVWHPLLQLYIAIMCGKWPGVWFQACKWALNVFVHSTHLLFVLKVTAFTDQFISKSNFFLLMKINCSCLHARLKGQISIGTNTVFPRTVSALK